MPKLGPSGLSVSSTHTPQAQDDYVITFDNVADTIDVLANDGGGNSASLFSLDQSFSLTPELTGLSSLGAFIGISNGEVTYDPTQSLALDSLVLGQQLQDSFIYWERLGNGTLSSATVHVTVEGTVKPLIGVVEDGYISGATVFIDSNGNGLFDRGVDPSTTTDSNGNFTLTTSLQGPLIAFGGTNIDTGLPNTLTFTAPEGATVINSLTTILETLVADGMTIVQGEQAIATGIQPSLTGVDLLNYDPIASGALNTQITVAQIDTVIESAVDHGVSEGAIIDALASDYAAGSSVDVQNAQSIEALYQRAGWTEAPLVLADAVANQNVLIEQAPTAAAITSDQASYGTANPSVIRAGLGDHTITASGTETLYLSTAPDNVILSQGGTYTIWGVEGSDWFNLGQLDLTASNEGNGYANLEFALQSYSTTGVDASGTPYIEFDLPGRTDPSNITTVRFMGVSGDDLVNMFYDFNIWAGESLWGEVPPSQYGYYAPPDPPVTTIAASDQIITPDPTASAFLVTGQNNVFDLSAGGRDVLHIAGGTGTTTVWGFNPANLDELDLSATAAGSGGWSQFESAVQSTGHEGQDALGNPYYEFNLGNADIVMMGVTAAQFSQMEANHSTFGF